ncbi:MAG: HNH endonuclease [Sedimentisphaerales bacterium]|nr:HNH endonuclease [Sedimentisphaerales bacterium]
MKWQVTKSGNIYYPTHGEWDPLLSTVRLIYMHRLIMNPPSKMQVDHIDGDGLNNQRANLRICTQAENARNRRKHNRRQSSKFKGVCFDKRDDRWRAYIKKSGKRYYLGYFDSEVKAASAYDVAARKHFKQYACTNL